jgi:hypothetical protein
MLEESIVFDGNVVAQLDRGVIPMSSRMFTTAAALLVVFGLSATESYAQRGRGRGPGGGGAVRAVPRADGGRSQFRRPNVVRVVPYRPYFYRPGFGLGLDWYYGYPYGFYPYGYYSSFGYPYGYPYPAGYIGATYGRAYGGVRIKNAPRDAQVFVDGYYAGEVDDFDGTLQKLDLAAGAHHLEIRASGSPPMAVDVNILPGETITYRAHFR